MCVRVLAWGVAGEVCLSPLTVKSTLTLMFSCGMYDYSGEWCVRVGLPAKSGVAGLVYIVIPNVCYSQRKGSGGERRVRVNLLKAVC